MSAVKRIAGVSVHFHVHPGETLGSRRLLYSFKLHKVFPNRKRLFSQKHFTTKKAEVKLLPLNKGLIGFG